MCLCYDTGEAVEKGTLCTASGTNRDRTVNADFQDYDCRDILPGSNLPEFVGTALQDNFLTIPQSVSLGPTPLSDTDINSWAPVCYD